MAACWLSPRPMPGRVGGVEVRPGLCPLPESLISHPSMGTLRVRQGMRLILISYIYGALRVRPCVLWRGPRVHQGSKSCRYVSEATACTLCIVFTVFLELS